MSEVWFVTRPFFPVYFAAFVPETEKEDTNNSAGESVVQVCFIYSTDSGCVGVGRIRAVGLLGVCLQRFTGSIKL